MSDEEYIGAEDAAKILRVTSRMVYRYGEGETPKLRTIRTGRRILFHQGDVQALAEEQNASQRPSPTTDIIPASELLDFVRELQGQLMLASRRIGELEGILGQRLLPEDEQALKKQITDLTAERDQLQQERERLQAELEKEQAPTELEQKRSWWQKLFGS